MGFDAQIERAIDLLKRRGRVSYRALALELETDAATLDALRAELCDVLGVARDHDRTILEWIGGAARAAKAERRRLTVVFCDMVDSTQLSTRLDPEDLRNLVRDFQSACARVVERLDGHVAQFLGDGVLVYFGWPRAHEQDAQRALHAALDIVQAIRQLRSALEARGLPPIAVRVGVHTGAAVVGEVGAGSRFETLALGETPNVAARVHAFAELDSVLASDETRRLAEGWFDFEDLGERTLKGVDRPLRVHRVLGKSDARAAIDIAAARGLTPLVDRDDVRALLEEAWAEACGGAGTAVELCGEAGIGKSRLQHHAKQSIAAGDRALFECQGSPFHTNTALYPVAGALAEAWDLRRSPDPLERIDARVSSYRLGGEARALFALLCGLELPPEQLGEVAGWTPQRVRQHTLRLVTEVVRCESLERPVLFVVEDLHWVNPSTLELVQLLLERTKGARVLTLMTARPEFAAPWRDGDRVRLVRVGPFSSADAAAMIRQVARGVDVPEDVAEMLGARTEGIPLFVEELTRTLLDAGKLAGGTSAGLAAAGAIPSSLYGCLMARLDGLGAARAIAPIAAVVGRTFTRSLVAKVGGVAEDEVAAAIAELLAAGLCFAVEGSPDQYRFKHALVQKVALESLLRSALQAYHRRAAEVLAESFPDVAGAEPERVAHHLTEAEAWPDAIAWWQKAGTAALLRSANHEAIAHFSRALALSGKLPESRERDETEMMLRILHAVPLTMTRGWAAPEVGAEYERAHDLGQRVSDAPQLFPALVGLLTYYIVRGRFRRAAEMASRHLAVAEKSGALELVLEGEHDCGTTQFYLGNLEAALEHLERCRALYVAEQHFAHAFVYGKDPGAVAMVHSALVHALAGRAEQALAVAEQSVEHTRRWPHPFSHIWALCGLAATRVVLGDRQAVLATAREIVAQAEAQGFPNWLAQGWCYLGYGLAHGGDADEGVAQLRQGIALWVLTGAELLTPFLRWMLADALFLAGDRAGAGEALEEAIRLAEANDERWFFSELLRLKGRLLAAGGDRDGARVWLGRAREDALSRGAHAHAARAEQSLQEVCA